MLKTICLALLALILTSPAAAADWLRAESDHFVVHAKLEEAKMRDLVLLMEDYDKLLNSQLPRQTPRGRKFEVFLDDNYNRISSVSAFRNIGFGLSSPEIVTSFSQYKPSEDLIFRHYALFSAQTSYHMNNGFFRPNPLWVRAGVPLFFATGYRNEEGDFILGAPDIRRQMKGKVNGSNLARLLATTSPAKSEKSWARFANLSREVINPLLIEPSYSGLLEQYLNAYAKGESAEEAGSLFGDLDELAKQIQKRRSTQRPTFRRVTLPPQAVIDVTIRLMQPDEIALVVPRFHRLRDDKHERSASRLKKLTKRFPQSALSWYEFAAAEFARVQSSQFGGEPVFKGFGFSNGELIVTANPYSDAEAWRAVNLALSIQPDLAPAIRLRAEILLSRLVKAGEADPAEYDAVRAALLPLARDPETNPFAAALTFQSYIEQGIEPPYEAIDLLGKAFVANAGVEEFRYAYAVALVRRGKKDVAETLLTSMLNNPDYSAAAQRVLDQNF